MDTAASPAADDQIINDRELFAVVWKRRRLIAVCGLASTLVFSVLAFLMTPVFRGSAVLVPAVNDRSMLEGSLSSALGSVGGLASLAGLNLGSRESQVEESLAVLRSHEFTENFIETNHLMPLLFPKKWDAARGQWKGPPEEHPTLNRAFKVFDDMRKVTRDTKTGLITLQIDFTDRYKAAEWTNLMVDQLNGEMRARAIRNSDASLGFLQKELATTIDVGTRDAVNRLIESEIKQKMLANVTQQYSLRFVDRALVPDRTDKVAPKKSLIIASGLILGVLMGCFLAFVLNLRDQSRRSRT